jgi:hypothetical protein
MHLDRELGDSARHVHAPQVVDTDEAEPASARLSVAVVGELDPMAAAGPPKKSETLLEEVNVPRVDVDRMVPAGHCRSGAIPQRRPVVGICSSRSSPR